MSMEVTREIQRQLGGRMFTLMTGAKNYMGSETENFLSFRLPGNGFSKYNYVKITLNGKDLYNVDLRNIPRELVKRQNIICEDLYAEDLIPYLEDKTGLRLRMPKIIGVNA